jgi:hypothetical protein
MSKTFQMSLPPHTSNSESPRIRGVLEQAQQQVGFIPNMYARMVNSPGLLETYLTGYDRFRKESGFTPTENGCHYCVAAHSVLADKFSHVPTAVTDAIRDGTLIPEPKLRALSEFTRILIAKGGRPDRADVDAFLAAGYTERHILEIILAVAVKTLSNWSNHVFNTPVDAMFAAREWTPAPAKAAAA